MITSLAFTTALICTTNMQISPSSSVSPLLQVSSITDKATLTSVIQNHISTVAGRYKGQVRSWVGCIDSPSFVVRQLTSNRMSSTKSSTKTELSDLPSSSTCLERVSSPLPSKLPEPQTLLPNYTSTTSSTFQLCASDLSFILFFCLALIVLMPS